MKVLFITPYYPPEIGAAQTRIHDLAVRLATKHQVSVLTTFPNYPSGVVPPEWRGKLWWKDTDQGTTVYRIWSYAAPNRGFLKRIIMHLSFAVFALLAALLMPRHDVMVIQSPPLFDGFVGLVSRALRRIPYAFMVSDLWPESAVQMGMLKQPFLVRLSTAAEMMFYRRSSMILALTAGIQRAIVGRGIDLSKVLLFRNAVDCQFFHPVPSSNGVRRDLGLSESSFVVLYAGNFGLAQNLGTVLEAAAQMQKEKHKEVMFLFVGDGADTDRLKAKARQLNLENTMFLAPVTKSHVPGLLNAADCVVVPLRDLEIFRGALPTKIFEAMASSKPLILSVAGEAEQLVRTAGAGCCVPPEDPQAICDAVARLIYDREAAARMGANGREYVARHFSRESRAMELSDALERVVCERRHPVFAFDETKSERKAA